MEMNLINQTQLLERFNISKYSLSKLIREGKLNIVNLNQGRGGACFFNLQEVEKVISNNTTYIGDTGRIKMNDSFQCNDITKKTLYVGKKYRRSELEKRLSFYLEKNLITIDFSFQGDGGFEIVYNDLYVSEKEIIKCL